MTDQPEDMSPIEGPLQINEKDFTDCIMGAGVLLRTFEHRNGRPMDIGEIIGNIGEILNLHIADRKLSVGEAKNLLMLASALGLKGEERK